MNDLLKSENASPTKGTAITYLTDPQTFRASCVTSITFKQLRDFLVAAESNNFSEAARLVFQSQSAFSRCIQELESALGEKVFDRSNQGAKLSDFGQAFLPRARQLVASYAEIQSDMSRWCDRRKGKLILAGNTAVMDVVLPVLFSRLSNEFEQSSLEFEDCNSERVITKVLTRRATLGVCALNGEQPELKLEPLLKAPLGLLFSPECKLEPTITSLEDLKHLPFMRFADESVVNQAMRSHHVALDAYFGSRLQVNNLNSAFCLIRAEKRVLIASGFSASNPQAADLRFVPLPELLPSIQCCLITRRDSPFDERQHLMKEVVKDTMLTAKWHASVQHTNAQ